VAIRCSGEAIASGFEECVDLIVGGKEALCLPSRLEAAHDFLSPSGRSVAAFKPIVQALMRAAICVRCQLTDRLATLIDCKHSTDVQCIPAQLIGNDHPWLAKLCDQPCQKALGGFGTAACLNQDIEGVTLCIDGPPKPVFHTIDRDHGLVQMLFVVKARALPADADSKMCAKPVDPKADRFAPDDNTALRQKIFNIGCAERKAVVGPDRIGEDLARIAKALQSPPKPTALSSWTARVGTSPTH